MLTIGMFVPRVVSLSLANQQLTEHAQTCGIQQMAEEGKSTLCIIQSQNAHR